MDGDEEESHALSGSENTTSDISSSLKKDWSDIARATPGNIRLLVADAVRRHAPDLSGRFYVTMLADPEATAFLGNAIVETRLGNAMQHWLIDLFEKTDTDGLSAIIAEQRQVGDSHAQIRVPINLVGKGMRYLKQWTWELIADDTRLDRDRLKTAIIYINHLIDFAFETMNAAFVANSGRTARTDEAYRLFSLSQDLAIERERQRAALVEWNHQIMNAVYRRHGAQAPLIGNSEFGLWLVHKALFMFDRSLEIHQIRGVIEQIDRQIVPQFHVSLPGDRIAALFTRLDSDVSKIKFLLTALFDRYMEVENGRDTLTKLLNRRFLPSAIMREIDLANKKKLQFAVMLIDIDHFKRVNDSYGHDAGDIVLQQTAALIMDAVRSGDFVFRYGGEEILVLLVNVDQSIAMAVAEKIRLKIDQTNILLSGERILRVSISVGVAVYDGHPDHRRMITRADVAVYEAKNGGRNRCVLAT